jgi:hypothetical protein
MDAAASRAATRIVSVVRAGRAESLTTWPVGTARGDGEALNHLSGGAGAPHAGTAPGVPDRTATLPRPAQHTASPEADHHTIELNRPRAHSPTSSCHPLPTAFRLNGTTCNADSDPSTPPTDPPPTDPPPTGDGTAPALRVSGNKFVDAVRATGAENVILAGGLAYSNDLGQWLTYKPHDPAGNLAASYHVYNFNTCSSTSCWNSTLAPVAAQVPLVAGEIGENTCSHGFIDQVMKWFDDRGLSYLGWTWNTWDCSSGPSLISAYDGTPTAFGVGLRDHLRALSQ